MAIDFNLRFEMEVAPPVIVKVARLKATPILDTIPEEDDVELIEDQDVQLSSHGGPSLPSDWPRNREVLRAFLKNFSRKENM
jgi:hypothetical protein